MKIWKQGVVQKGDLGLQWVLTKWSNGTGLLSCNLLKSVSQPQCEERKGKRVLLLKGGKGYTGLRRKEGNIY